MPRLLTDLSFSLGWCPPGCTCDYATNTGSAQWRREYSSERATCTWFISSCSVQASWVRFFSSRIPFRLRTRLKPFFLDLYSWINLGTFNILAWQAYFVAGQYLGYRGLSTGEGAVPRSRVLLVVCIVLSLFFFLDRHREFILGVTPLLKFSIGPSRNPARFLDAACLGYVIWWFPRAINRKLMTLRLFKFFNRLGKHSLQVFAYSLFVRSEE